MVTGRIFKKFNNEIKAYCAENDLSFDRLCKSPCCFDNEELNILMNDSDPEREKLGLMDNIPIPTVLKILHENGKLRFVQTEHTREYLGTEEENKFVAMPKAAVA